MNKILLSLFIGIFLISFSTAWGERGIIQPDLRLGLMDNGVMISDTAMEYPAIEIRNNFDLPLISSTEADLVLTDHTAECGIDCLSTFNINTYSDSALVDGVKFYTIDGNSRIEQPIRSYQFYIKTDVQTIDVPDYETQCVDGETTYNETINGTVAYTPQICEQVLVGSHQEETPEWTPYNIGDVLPAGSYTVKLEGQKRPDRTVDWVITTQGKELNEWATWYATIYSPDRAITTDSGWTDDGSKTAKQGVKIVANGNYTLQNVTKPATSALTKAYVLNSSKSILKTVDYVGNIATLNYTMVAGTTYYIVGDGNGASVQRQRKATSSYPFTFTEFNYTGMLGDGTTDGTSQIYDIVAINVSNSSQGQITLNSPTNLQSLSSNSVNFNATATVVGGATLTNMSLFTNSSGTWAINQTISQSIENTNIDLNVVSSRGTESSSTTDGLKIYAISSFTIFNITKYAGTNAGTAYILDSNKNLLTSVAFVGNIAKINYTVTSGNYYYIVAGGGTYIRSFPAAAYSTYPVNFSTLQVVGAVRGTSDYTNNGWDNIVNITIGYNTSSSTQLFTNTYPSGSNIKWNVQACDSDGACGFATSNYTFSIDNIAPTIALNYPTSLIDYGRVNGTLQLNLTATNSNLDKVWYNYNGTNITIGATSGVANLSNITLSTIKSLTIYANDTAGNLNATTFNWDYKVFENSQSYNSTIYETANENYTINITANSSLTNVYLNLNGTYYSMIQSNNNWSTNIDEPLGAGVLNNNFVYTYSGTNITGDSFNQTISQTIFQICNATYPTLYLNYTFRNETTSAENVTASIISSFIYYLGNGNTNKTYAFSNSTVNTNYSFCASPNLPLKIIPNIQYTNPYSITRSYNPPVNTYSASNTRTVLYLLPTVLGTYARFVTSVAGVPIGGVTALVTRLISGNTVTIATGLTDSSGLYAVFLDPTASYSFQFSLIDYTSNSFSLTPNSPDIYNVYMTRIGGTTQYTNNGTQIGTNLNLTITPSNSSLYNNTVYSFGFHATGNNLTFISENITDKHGNVLGYTSGTSGLITLNINTTNLTEIIGSYIVKTENENLSFTRTWIIGNYYTGSYSLFALLTSWDIYNFDYSYYKIIIVMITLVIAIGGLSKIEIIDTSESKIGVGVFIIWAYSYVGWLTINLIPNATALSPAAFINQFGIAVLATLAGIAGLKEWIS